MSKELIVAPAIAPTPTTIQVSDEAKKIKADLLARAGALVITRESTVETRDLAIALAGEMATHLKVVESDRKEVKQPFWDTGKAIDTAASEHSSPLEDKLKALNRGIGAVNDRLEHERLVAQQALAAEQARIAKQQQDALDRQAELELAAAPKGKKAQAAQLAAELEAQEAQEVADEKQRKLDDERIRQAELARQAKPVTGSGAQRTEIDITITDIKALYAAFPNCVKMEPDLVQIRWMINNMPNVLPLPGVTHVKRAVFSAKAR